MLTTISFELSLGKSTDYETYGKLEHEYESAPSPDRQIQWDKLLLVEDVYEIPVDVAGPVEDHPGQATSGEADRDGESEVRKGTCGNLS